MMPRKAHASKYSTFGLSSENFLRGEKRVDAPANNAITLVSQQNRAAMHLQHRVKGAILVDLDEPVVNGISCQGTHIQQLDKGELTCVNYLLTASAVDHDVSVGSSLPFWKETRRGSVIHRHDDLIPFNVLDGTSSVRGAFDCLNDNTPKLCFRRIDRIDKEAADIVHQFDIRCVGVVVVVVAVFPRTEQYVLEIWLLFLKDCDVLSRIRTITT